MTAGLTQGDWATLEAIGAFVRTGVMTAATDGEIAEVSSISVTTVRRALPKWESRGVLRREGRGLARRVWIDDPELYRECLRLRAAGLV